MLHFSLFNYEYSYKISHTTGIILLLNGLLRMQILKQTVKLQKFDYHLSYLKYLFNQDII